MKRALVALAMVAALPSLARAQDLKDRFNIRLIAQGLYIAEHPPNHKGEPRQER